MACHAQAQEGSITVKPKFPDREPHRSLLATENWMARILGVALVVGLMLYWLGVL